MIKTSLVIVGGGFGGVACARECARLFKRRPDIDITLVTPRPYHDYHGALYEMATAIEQEAGGRAHQRIDKGSRGACLRKAVCLPLEEIFRGTQVMCIHGTVTSVDRKKRQVRISHGTSLFYSYLVLALGSVPAFHSVSGIREHALALKTIDDALSIRHMVLGAWKKKCHEATHRTEGAIAPLKIAIGGGGFTGVEFAAELAGMLKTLSSRLKEEARAPYEIILLSGNSLPLSQLGDTISHFTEVRLSACGIQVKQNSRIAKVERQRYTGREHSLSSTIATLHSGERMKADIFIWAGGVEAATLYQKLFPLYIGGHGRLVVEPQLMVTGEERIFAVGDGAYLTTDQYPFGLPMQATIAVAEGVHAARNIARAVSGQPLVPFQCPRVPFVVPLGGKYAVGIMPGGTMVQGFTAWLYKQWLELNYYVKLLGVIRGIGVWASMEKICLRNDWRSD